MIAHEAAVCIMDALHRAESDLLDATVVTFNAESGTVRKLVLDDHHGLCFTFDPPGVGRRFYPVSTIRMKS